MKPNTKRVAGTRMPVNPVMFEAFAAARIRPGASPKHTRFIAKVVGVMERHGKSVLRIEAARVERRAAKKASLKLDAETDQMAGVA